MTKIERATVRRGRAAARGADHDIDAPAQRAELMFVADAAVDGEHSGVSARRCGCKVGGDLACQLAGRGHDERLRGAGLGELGVVAFVRDDDPLQQRDAERQGLAGAGTCLADHVGAGQRDGNGHGLDRERCGDADLVEGLHNRVDHAEIGKSGRRDRRRGDFGPGWAS